MRILIFSETEAAKQRLHAERAAGHTVSLRASDWFKASELEPCQSVITDDAAIKAVYEARGIPVLLLTAVKPAAKPQVAPTPSKAFEPNGDAAGAVRVDPPEAKASPAKKSKK